MILIKNRLIFGTIRKFIKFIFGSIYKVVTFLSLQFTLLVLLIGAVLYFTGAMDVNPVIAVIFYVLLVASVIFAVILSIGKIVKKDKPIRKQGGMQIINNQQETEETTQVSNTLPTEERIEKSQIQSESLVKYYTVKQNPNYIMAEYLDRYELYYKTPQGLKKIRTDYKTR